MAKLILKTGKQRGMEFEVKAGLVLGRRLELPLHLNDTKASREHAKIVAEPGGLAIVDLGSTNGTFVNGTRVPRARLNHGDTLRIGQTEMTFHDPESAEPEPAPIPHKPPVRKAPAAPKIDLGAPPPKKVNVRLKSSKSRRDRLK